MHDLGGQADKTIDIGGRKVIIQITKDFIKIIEPTDNFEIVAKGIDPATQKRNNFTAVRKYNILLQINGTENQIPETAVKWEEEYDDTALGINCNHISSTTIALIDPVQAWKDEASNQIDIKAAAVTEAYKQIAIMKPVLGLNDRTKTIKKSKTKAKEPSCATNKTRKLNRRGSR